ncbi:PLP-dependent transferase [Psychroflexus torquis]|uniref:PLP-dependent transferase n=1 Tax=Psychroflexus torquis TaxID=57029 RepID=UPI0000D52A0D
METIDYYKTNNTKLIWAEIPTNPIMNVTDIKAFAKKHNVLLQPPTYRALRFWCRYRHT